MLDALTFEHYSDRTTIRSGVGYLCMAGTISLKMILGNINMLPLFITVFVAGVIIYAVSYYIKDKAIFLELDLVLKGS